MDSKFDFAVIGAGRMGASIAGQLAIQGAKVAVYDKSDFDRKKGFEIMRADMKLLVDSRLLIPKDRDDALDGITLVDSIEAAVSAPLVIEVIYEDLDAKRELFAKLQAACSNTDTVFASNSINHPIQDIAEPGIIPPTRQVCGVRFLHPVFFMPPVEVTSVEDSMPSRLRAPVWDHLARFNLAPFYAKANPGGFWRRKLDFSEVERYNDAQRRRVKAVIQVEGEELMSIPSRRPSVLGECSICLENNANCVLAPCGHDMLCMQCAAHIRRGGKPCPTCRSPIERVLEKEPDSRPGTSQPQTPHP
uniref:RING-type domain-containing protein n=1 Tax=Hemiselmis andersenii TaxID=464988 RepID=A0A6T8N154_HEMAN|mmetsp:Transcript_38966/g.90908  ORF Transcript_38966/g.90908 Transcript_38966/m.90908 type:complete len:304 (+) Transcript_38966:216-1127(+)